ncbi:YajQ family cyclic di-GMP-binding protein [Rubrivivax rivuli]|uniref:Nucleotide-binding protein EOE66_09885 n=1 Tax=Rubrivivax rivuli TaxID=1862385 RepID=A0A437RHC5_9BURK|nr:YajQ family cyclic di-GMP-binding protein [Rubrivivax rivuli]RVU46162.1 YajQ family cyclic di-GMP-binding protein [Rubrivivax rivuli]
MPSFDAVIEPDLVELRNAVEQAQKEIANRFDFKGSSAQVDLTSPTPKTRELTLWADSDFQLGQVKDVLITKLSKRNVDIRLLDFSATPQKMSHDKLKLSVPVKSGVDAETAKKMQAALKASKLKVQAAFQGDALRVTGAKRDTLQEAIALLRKELNEWPLSFNNFRE